MRLVNTENDEVQVENLSLNITSKTLSQNPDQIPDSVYWK